MPLEAGRGAGNGPGDRAENELPSIASASGDSTAAKGARVTKAAGTASRSSSSNTVSPLILSLSIVFDGLNCPLLPLTFSLRPSSRPLFKGSLGLPLALLSCFADPASFRYDLFCQGCMRCIRRNATTHIQPSSRALWYHCAVAGNDQHRQKTKQPNRPGTVCRGHQTAIQARPRVQ